MESWRRVWRDAIVPLLSDKSLAALRHGLESDDPRLIQGGTTTPPPLPTVQDWPVEAACALGYCGAVELGGFKDDPVAISGPSGYANRPATVGEVEEFFARMCMDIDQCLGEPAGCRWFLNHWDETPRQVLREEMLPELMLALEARHAG